MGYAGAGMTYTAPAQWHQLLDTTFAMLHEYDTKVEGMASEIIVDGVRFVPEGKMDVAPWLPPIGIAVTTRNRPDVLETTIKHIRAHTPNAYLVVVDDASDKAVWAGDADVVKRFDTNVGIARAKNKCLELLMERGCEHLFLFDDDTYPTELDWEKRYVDSPEPHLCYLFKDHGTQGRPQDSPVTIFDDGTLFALAHPRGCMLYAQRSVVDRVGGMRPEFGICMHEHVEWSLRIHNAGLTTAPYQDVHGSPVIHSMDEHVAEHKGFARSIPLQTRKEELAKNTELFEHFSGTTDYVEYRQLDNAVVSVMLTGKPDPQRGKVMDADRGPWYRSIQGALAICLLDDPDTEYAIRPSNWSPYTQRWVNFYQYLRDNRFQWLWLTDCTDVEMLREPWDDMKSGVLYVGHEPTVVGCEWMVKNHPTYTAWIAEHHNEPLLNAGVVGGDYETVLAFTAAMVRELMTVPSAKSDMASFNKVARQSFYTAHGPGVVTQFKSNERNSWSWWKHK